MELIAQGPQGEDRWRRVLPVEDTGMEIIVGRAAGGWSVAWDEMVSRQHVRLTLNKKGVRVCKLPTARNPVFFKGRQCDDFHVSINEHFVIGHTSFTLVEQPAVSSLGPPVDLTQRAYAPQQLRRHPFRDATGRIEVLRRLPELISSSTSDSELWVRVVTVLMQGIPNATAVAVVMADTSAASIGQSDHGVRVLHYDSRQASEGQRSPSASLAREAIDSGQSVLHLWGGTSGVPVQYTQREGIDWALCVPVVDTNERLALYVSGAIDQAGSSDDWLPESGEAAHRSAESAHRPAESRSTHADNHQHAANLLQDDLRFSELVASTVGNVRKIGKLQQQQAGLRQFFSPVVMSALAASSIDDALAPRESELSVLFCDLRGFSRHSEQSQNQLMELLQRVSESLGVMTRHILATGGVIGDFHGDAAMGFWGWPIDQSDAALGACSAAMGIASEFSSVASAGRLANFRCGIGIASGRAVAGRIGTSDQVKVTAFGPVVNRASRLEGMTKSLAAEVLIDEATADFVRQHVSPKICRVRRLAPVRPAGMQSAVVVSQLLPPQGPLCSLTDQDIHTYEQAFDAFIQRRWEEAFDRLHEVPATDRAKDFLTVFIARHQRSAPQDWDGAIDIPK